jgi:hypothetical protein
MHFVQQPIKSHLLVCLYTAFIKHCSVIQLHSEMKVWNKSQDKGEKKDGKKNRRRNNIC